MKAILPRLLISSLLMGVFCYGAQLIIPFPKPLLLRIGVVGLWVGGGFLAYIITARLIGAFHFRDLQRLLKNQSAS
jgi:hypothetical protein